jgi:hypothetical protein
VLKKSLAGGTTCPTSLQVLDLRLWRRRFRLCLDGAQDFFSTLLGDVWSIFQQAGHRLKPMLQAEARATPYANFLQSAGVEDASSYRKWQTSN